MWFMQRILLYLSVYVPQEHKQRDDREHTRTQNKEIILQDYVVVMHVNKVNKDFLQTNH